MEKENLKVILKPLIKQCIKECILEEGVLSGIITEVVKGMETQRVITEGLTVKNPPSPDPDPQEVIRKEEEYERDRQERIRRLNESANISGVNVFEDVQPVVAEAQPSPEPAVANPLSGVAPNDSGVDISGIMAISQGKWKDLM